MNLPRYSIVIPTYNHCDDLLKPCIESIIKYSELSDIEIIISANGCTDNTQEYLTELQQRIPNNLKFVWNDSAIGFAKAVNAGIKIAAADKIVLLNNDCVLLNQNKNKWLKILEQPFKDYEKCGISCIIKEYSQEIKQYFAVFFCVMIDIKVFDKVGFLSEDYGIGFCEDMDFCYLAEKNGFEIHEVFKKERLNNQYYTGNFPIYHKGEGTVHDTSLIQNWDDIVEKNKLKLSKKWNTNMKKIGVITPVYNNVNLIHDAINCVKSQTVQNVIHYIFDDASSDGLYDAVEEILDQSIVYIGSGKNFGQSNARNQLLKKALEDGCEVIAFLDVDDVWNNDHLETSLKYLEESDVVYSTPYFIDETSAIVQPVNITVPDIFVGKQLLHNNFIWISSVVAKSKCFVNNQFDDNLNSLEDWDMWIRLWQQDYSFVKKPETSCRYLVKMNGQAAIGTTKHSLLAQKHKMLPKLKLHLACGHDYNDDYINVDFYAPEDAKCDVRFDVQKLPYPDNSVDEIKAFHIIEHFHFFEIKEVLNEWYRVLKPGGRLYLETPDFLESCRSFVEGNPAMPLEDWRFLLYGHFFAYPWVPGQIHKFLFTETQIKANLSWAGFKKVNRLPPASNYVMPHTVPLFLNVEAFK